MSRLHIGNAWRLAQNIKFRQRLLQIIREHGPINPEAIGDRLDLSRAWVSENLRVMEQEGWITHERSRYTFMYSSARVGDYFPSPDKDDVEYIEPPKWYDELPPNIQWMMGVLPLELRA
jgi:hypothetical protein